MTIQGAPSATLQHSRRPLQRSSRCGHANSVSGSRVWSCEDARPAPRATVMTISATTTTNAPSLISPLLFKRTTSPSSGNCCFQQPCSELSPSKRFLFQPTSHGPRSFGGTDDRRPPYPHRLHRMCTLPPQSEPAGACLHGVLDVELKDKGGTGLVACDDGVWRRWRCVPGVVRARVRRYGPWACAWRRGRHSFILLVSCATRTTRWLRHSGRPDCMTAPFGCLNA